MSETVKIWIKELFEKEINDPDRRLLRDPAPDQPFRPVPH